MLPCRMKERMRADGPLPTITVSIVGRSPPLVAVVFVLVPVSVPVSVPVPVLETAMEVVAGRGNDSSVEVMGIISIEQ